MTPQTHHRLELAAVVGIFLVAACVILLCVIGIASTAGYIPQ